MRKLSTLAGLILFLAAIEQGAASNCYIRISPGQESTREQNRSVLESYGARIIHEFPPSEFICDMTPRQFTKLISERLFT